MKIKIKILIVSCLMAAAAVTGFNMAQNSNNMDVSLADIAVMAMARGESGGDCGSGCPSGWVCVNGVCVQLKQAYQVDCTYFCWYKFRNVPGKKIECHPDSNGSTNCNATSCTPNPGEC